MRLGLERLIRNHKVEMVLKAMDWLTGSRKMKTKDRGVRHTDRQETNCREGASTEGGPEAEDTGYKPEEWE